MQKWLVKVGSFLMVAGLGPIAACTAGVSNDDETTESAEQAASRGKQKASGSASASGSAPQRPTPAADARCGLFDFQAVYLFKAEYEGDAPPIADDDIIAEKQHQAIQAECMKKLFEDPKFDKQKTPIDPRTLPASCGTCPKGKTGCDMTNIRGNFAIETSLNDAGVERYKCTSNVKREGNPNDGYRDVHTIWFEYDCSACTAPGCTPTPSGSAAPSSSSSSSSAAPSASASGSGSAPAPAPSGSGSGR